MSKGTSAVSECDMRLRPVEGVEATPFRCGGALDLCVAFRGAWGKICALSEKLYPCASCSNCAFLKEDCEL
jgi:hypothetical protein